MHRRFKETRNGTLVREQYERWRNFGFTENIFKYLVNAL